MRGALTYDPARPFTVWVHAIARYKLSDHLRRRYDQPAATLEETESVAAADDSGQSEAATRPDAAPRCHPGRTARLDPQRSHRGPLDCRGRRRRRPSRRGAVKVGIHRGLRALASKVQGKP